MNTPSLYEGIFLIELSNRRGRWRVRATKPGGMVRYQRADYAEWISATYMHAEAWRWTMLSGSSMRAA